jgi:CheY-like chemotaxis protein
VKQTALIADDEKDIIDLLRGLFEDDFHLVFALNGDELFEQLNASIDIIILDMHLPGRSGIEICKHIATLDSERRPAIIVISGDTSDALVKSAYDLGISDYIGKPFNLVTFHERIIRFSRDIKAIHELEQKDKRIESLAQTAMKQAASYGRALELVAKLNDCRSPLDIMHAVASNMLSQDLKIAIQLRSDAETYSYDVDTGECSPVELQIFDVLKEHGRIYHFGRRTIFNDHHVSILFKNMPFEGTLSFDAVLDVAAKFILAVNSRFISLLQQQSLISTKDKLGSALEMP